MKRVEVRVRTKPGSVLVRVQNWQVRSPSHGKKTWCIKIRKEKKRNKSSHQGGGGSERCSTLDSPPLFLLLGLCSVSTNLLHTCPFLPSPVTRLPLYSGRWCRWQGGCCCMARGTAMNSCLVASKINNNKNWSSAETVHLSDLKKYKYSQKTIYKERKKGHNQNMEKASWLNVVHAQWSQNL